MLGAADGDKLSLGSTWLVSNHSTVDSANTINLTKTRHKHEKHSE